MSKQLSAKAKFLASVLKPGEIYAGIILGKNGEPDYHLILISEHYYACTFERALEFAANAGGELPTRRELALLYANLSEEFLHHICWSSEIEGYDVWCQGMGSGHQHKDNRAYHFDACVVRRIEIE